jgi:hypothetical protein
MTDIREYTERNGCRLPDFVAGMTYTINGERLVVVRVLAVKSEPCRVDVEVEPEEERG